jgi:hypothetical protein
MLACRPLTQRLHQSAGETGSAKRRRKVEETPAADEDEVPDEVP